MQCFSKQSGYWFRHWVWQPNYLIGGPFSQRIALGVLFKKTWSKFVPFWTYSGLLFALRWRQCHEAWPGIYSYNLWLHGVLPRTSLWYQEDIYHKQQQITFVFMNIVCFNSEENIISRFLRMVCLATHKLTTNFLFRLARRNWSELFTSIILTFRQTTH